MEDLVSVVILNYNGLSVLQRFLPSVKQNSEGAQVIVIDNASTDASVNYLEQSHSDVKVIRLAENYGFSGGYNRGLLEIQTKYTVLLNSDVETPTNWLTPMVSLMEGNEKVAACQPKMLSLSNKGYFDYAGAAGGFLDNLGIPFCRGRLFYDIEKDKGQYDDTIPIFWATGACMLVRTHLLQKFPLDETFFMYMEEIDWCWRMQCLGYEVVYCGDSKVFHLGGQAFNHPNPKKTFFNVRNSLIVLRKNLPQKQRFSTIFLRLIADGLAGIYFLFQGKPHQTLSILRGHFAFYAYILKNFPLPKQETKPFKELRKQAKSPNGSILWKYFIQKRKTFAQLLK